MSRRSRQRNSFCRNNRKKKLRKPGLMSATEKPAQTRQEFFLDFFLVESTRTQPEATDRHRQTPLRAHLNTPKIAVSPLGAQSTPPLAGCRSVHIQSRGTDTDVIYHHNGAAPQRIAHCQIHVPLGRSLVIPAGPSAGRRHQGGSCLFLSVLSNSLYFTWGPSGSRARTLLARCFGPCAVGGYRPLKPCSCSEVTPFLCLSNC